LDTLFPLFTILAIREPLIENSLVGDHSQIRVDSPSDIIFLEQEDPLLQNVTWYSGERQCAILSRSAEEWKEIGQKHYQSKEHFAAVVAYSYAMKLDPSMVPVGVDRASAHIGLGNHAAAIRDAESVIGFEELPVGSYILVLYVIANAHYDMGDYVEAKRWYQRLLEYPQMAEYIQQNLFACESREKEHSQANYNWELLYRKIISKVEPQISNFIGPVEVIDMPHRGGGRGVVATRDIDPGELLVEYLLDYGDLN
jgi:tetratricopeptide (TPR) repeat protein